MSYKFYNYIDFFVHFLKELFVFFFYLKNGIIKTPYYFLFYVRLCFTIKST